MNETTTYSQGIPQAESTFASASTQAATSPLDMIEKNPLPFVFGAVLLGLLVGMAVPSMHKSNSERYLEEPLEDIKDMLGRLTKAVRHGASDAMDSAESGATDAFKSVKSAFRKIW